MIPLKLRDTNISNRIPVARIAKKESSDPAMVNSDYKFKEDFDFLDEWVRQKKLPSKEEKKPSIQDSRGTRSISHGVTGPKKTSNQEKGKKGKDDCEIY